MPQTCDQCTSTTAIRLGTTATAGAGLACSPLSHSLAHSLSIFHLSFSSFLPSARISLSRAVPKCNYVFSSSSSSLPFFFRLGPRKLVFWGGRTRWSRAFPDSHLFPNLIISPEIDRPIAHRLLACSLTLLAHSSLFALSPCRSGS
jgi:hypothetical protein